MPGGGGDSTTTVEQQLAPEQREILQLISPIMQAYLTPRGQPVGGAAPGPQGGGAPTAGRQPAAASVFNFNTPIEGSHAAYMARQQQEQQAQQARAGGGARPVAGAGPQGMMPEPYPGRRLAATRPLETLGQNMVVRASRHGAGDVLGSAAGANELLTSGDLLDPRTNPGLAGAIQAAIDPLQQQFTTSILPNIRDEAILAGGYGGSRQGVAEGLASEGLLRQSGNAAANIINPAYQAGLEAMTRGVALAPTTAASQFLPGEAIAGVGAQRRAQRQAELDVEMQRYIEEQFLPFQIAQQVAAMAFGLPIAGTQTTGEAPGVPRGQQALGGAATGAAIGTAVPGIGTGVGAGVGGLAGLLGLFG